MTELYKWRGSILSIPNNQKVISILHPEDVSKDYSLRLVVSQDLIKINRESYHPIIKLPKRTLIIKPTLSQVFDYFVGISSSKFTSCDIETLRASTISCIGFSSCPRGSHAICIPFIHNKGLYWSGYEYRQICEGISDILADKNIKKCGQNFHYDWCYLARDGYEINNYYFDTLVAHHCAWPELPKDLGFLASIYTDEPYWKDEGKDHTNVKDWDQYWIYNCKDAAVTAELVKPLMKEVVDQGVEDTFNFEMQLIPRFVKSTLRGIRFDAIKCATAYKSVSDRLGSLGTDLDNLLPRSYVCSFCGGRGTTGKRIIKLCKECQGNVHHINPGSPKQLASLIYDHLGISRRFNRKTGNLSTNEDILVKLQLESPSPTFELLLEFRELDKERSFLGTTSSTDGRIRTTLSCSTDTGRLASRVTPFATGTNLQNVKHIRHIRSLFLADEDHILIEADYAKAEAMVVAYESQDEDYIKIFTDGLDIHTINAQIIFEKDSISYEERQLGKKVCHGLNYLMGIGTLRQSIVHELGPKYAITIEQANRFKDAYFNKFKGIARWHKELFKQLKETREATNCFNRKRSFLDRPDANTLKKFVAFIPQSTIGDLTNRALCAVQDTVSLVEFLHQIHDALLLQTHKDNNLREVINQIIKAMSIELTIHGRTFIVPVDIKTGQDWGNMETFK